MKDTQYIDEVYTQRRMYERFSTAQVALFKDTDTHFAK